MLTNGTITLRDRRDVFDEDSLSKLIAVWHELQNTSVEVAVASRTCFTLEEFAADHCIYFAGIFLKTDEAMPQRAWPEETLKPGQLQLQGETQQLYPSENFLRTNVVLIGAIYLASSQFDKEVNLGLALLPQARRNGYARQAVDCVLRWAFEECGYHRVQVAIMDGPHRAAAMRLFAGAIFIHEGRRERQVVNPLTMEYKDVTYMGIVDTDWIIRRYRRDIPYNAWEELFERHRREREALLEMDEAHCRLKRTASTETLKIKKEPKEDNQNKKQKIEHERQSTAAKATFGSREKTPHHTRASTSGSSLYSDWFNLYPSNIELGEATGESDNASIDTGSLGSSYDFVSASGSGRGASPPPSKGSLSSSSSEISESLYGSDAEQPLL